MTSAPRPPSANFDRDFLFLSETLRAAADAGAAHVWQTLDALTAAGWAWDVLAYGLNGARHLPQSATSGGDLVSGLQYLANQLATNASAQDYVLSLIESGDTAPKGAQGAPEGMTAADYFAMRGASGWQAERTANQWGVFVTDAGGLVSYDPPGPPDGEFQPGGNVTPDDTAPPDSSPVAYCPDGVTPYDPTAVYFADPCGTLPEFGPVVPLGEIVVGVESKRSVLPLLLLVAAVVTLSR